MNPAALLAFAAAFVGGVTAFLVGWSEQPSLARRTFVAGMALLTVESVFSGWSLSAATGEQVAWRLEGSLLCLALLPGIWLRFSLVYGRGNPQDYVTKWRPVLAPALVLPVALGLWSLGGVPGSVHAGPPGRWFVTAGGPGQALNLCFLVGAVLVLMNLERTLRAAVGTIRRRITLMVLGVGLLFVIRAYTISQALLFRGWDSSFQVVNAGALLAAGGLMLGGRWRAGRFDLEVYPSHAVLRNSLTVVLAGVYLLVIGVFARVVARLGGDEAFALQTFLVLVALVLLTLLLLSARVRWWCSRFVSRHLQRPGHDYRAVWRTFSEATAACVDQAGLSRVAVKLVADEFQLLSATLWLLDENKERLALAASTCLAESPAAELAPAKAELTGLLAALQKHAAPVDVDTCAEPWTATLKKCHPEKIPRGGRRVCVPLLVRGEVLGLLMVGDRVGGEAFSPQDFELLNSLGHQLAASLLNLRLSQNLMRTRELGAFQMMSAFFVHDLKNAASTLSLLLQNLPVHFDDPAFRQDALRATGNTVAHLNHLIERLANLQQELKIKPALSDLNDVVAQGVRAWRTDPAVALVTELQPVPKVSLDSEQILKVVTNLVLNAREAVARDGRIMIQTRCAGGWAVLSVTDNGCGMSRDFLKRSLFQAFQTTKKNGLGIGMFHSKMIVEAHQGRIEVESEPGRGTTFRVLLPLTP